ncbi:hypothetical protein AVEN_249228-1 [Araneus ventricosus]|uniref:THAP-type domain-containing protein n=1 Tax=Araneus ventricosus TaxID=182803 RepID=A0A4Y2P6Y6_ARAVE|nr:hypothetical protein AVEN_249228-1 [Araneus ventricosus]
MVYKCGVFDCKGNYASGQKVSIFKFLKDPKLSKIWETRIMRENFKPTTSSRVCELHFRKEDVLRETEYIDEKSGTLLRIPLQYPKLKEGAIPMFVSDKYPPSLQPPMIVSRESPSRKRKRLEDKLVRKTQEASIETANYYMKRVTFTNLAELNFLRNSKVFILPHESTLRRVCSEFGVNPSQEQDDDSFLGYITQKFNFLGDKDKTISLMIDEIHLRPTYDYVGGKLYVINNVVAEGLNLLGAENNIFHHKDTADYIKIIHRWWSVMNIKTKYKGDHKLDDFQKPLMKEFDSEPKYKFLIDFGQWLKRWEKMDSNTGCLTTQTHLAISHTTEAMPALAT